MTAQTLTNGRTTREVVADVTERRRRLATVTNSVVTAVTTELKIWCFNSSPDDITIVLQDVVRRLQAIEADILDSSEPSFEEECPF